VLMPPGRLLVLAVVLSFVAPLAGPRVAAAHASDTNPVASVTAIGTVEQTADVDGTYTSPLEVRLLDAYGQPVAGATVTFALGTGPTGASASFLGSGGQATAISDANGLATSRPFVANSSAGRFVGSASTMDIPAVATFSLTNHASSTTLVAVRGSTQRAPVDARFRQRLEVRALDAAGQPIEGATVTFAISKDAGGASASFPDGTNQATATTDAAGRASSPALIATNVAGRFTASASMTGVSTRATYALRVVAGKAASISAGAASGEVAEAGAHLRIPLAVTVSDHDKNPVAGAVVAFAAPSQGPSGRFGHFGHVVRVRTNADGIAVAPRFTANATLGGYALVARVVGTHLRTAFAIVNQGAL
jgi:protocatechuate 3,4-dioxygenase beta subunit